VNVLAHNAVYTIYSWILWQWKTKLCLWIHYPTHHLLKGCLIRSQKVDKQKKKINKKIHTFIQGHLFWHFFVIEHEKASLQWYRFLVCAWRKSCSTNVLDMSSWGLVLGWLPCIEVSELSACWTFIDIIACAASEKLRHSLFHKARLLLSEHSQAANSLMLNSQVLLALTDYLFNLSWVIRGGNIFTLKFHICMQVVNVLLQFFSYSGYGEPCGSALALEACFAINSSIFSLMHVLKVSLHWNKKKKIVCLPCFHF